MRTPDTLKATLPALLLAVGVASTAGAQSKPPAEIDVAETVGVTAYPSKGQSAAKQQEDERACLAWAEEQTGIPATDVAQGTAEQSGTGRSTKKGAVVGGAVGTGIGIITGHPLRGAATGAAAGGATGYAKGKSKQKGTKQAVETERQKLASAYSACLGGRGYSTR